MTRRRIPRVRVLVALIIVALAFSMFSSSAATLGGLGPDTLGGASGLTKHVTAVQLEWNRGESSTDIEVATLRLTGGSGQTFAESDVVDVTAAGASTDACSSTTTVSKDTAVVDVSFASCAIMLWDLNSVAVNISGARDATTLTSNVGVLRAGLSSIDGPVVQPQAPVALGYTTVGKGRVETLATMNLGVHDASVEQLVGRRAVVVLTTANGQQVSHGGTVGTTARNQGIWAQVDPKTSVPTVTADLSKLVPGGELPATANVAQVRMVLLQPHWLGTAQTASNRYAIVAAGVAVASSGGGATDVGSAVEPVGLDDRLTYKGKYTQKQDANTLRFCWDFTVKNTTKDPVEWQVTFDTSKPPMWGLDPTVVDPNGVGTLNGMWNAKTVDYQPTSGLWTVGGVNWNKTLGPNQSQTVGYCAHPEIPDVDASTFDEPIVSLVSSNDPHYVEFRIKVRSSSEFLVPWETEVDFADHVCPASIGDGLKAQNAVLTHIEGTRYRVRGTDNSFRFVSTKNKQDYVFASLRPNSDPFKPGCP